MISFTAFAVLWLVVIPALVFLLFVEAAKDKQ